jgi:Domain of unknown function (DUF6597)
LIGIRFHPGGTMPFFHLPMNELTNRVVELGSFARTLEAKLLSEAVHLPDLKTKSQRYRKYSWESSATLDPTSGCFVLPQE